MLTHGDLIITKGQTLHIICEQLPTGKVLYTAKATTSVVDLLRAVMALWAKGVSQWEWDVTPTANGYEAIRVL